MVDSEEWRIKYQTETTASDAFFGPIELESAEEATHNFIWIMQNKPNSLDSSVRADSGLLVADFEKQSPFPKGQDERNFV